MLEKGRRKIEAAGLEGVVGYTQEGARELALPKAEFDVAILVAVLADVGGTPIDVGVPHNGYPQLAGLDLEVAGVRTNRMPVGFDRMFT